MKIKTICISFLLSFVFIVGYSQALLVFEEINGPNNPFDGLSVGAYASPDLVDIDGDGDMDAFFALEEGNVVYYENKGNHLTPEFELIIGANNPLHEANGIAYADIAFVDIDADGDSDAFVGSVYAWIKFYENTGTNTNPIFVLQSGPNNPLDLYDEGFEAKLSFVDIDGDNDQDVFIGDDNGTIRFFRNDGNANNAAFLEIIGAENPLDQVYVGDFVNPELTDLDKDGDQDLILGEDSGLFHYFENTGNAEWAEFTQIIGADNPFQDFDAGVESKPAFCDIDGDGDSDLFSGNESGDIKYYENQTIFTAVNTANRDGFYLTPNPFQEEIVIKGDMVFQNHSTARISVLKSNGQCIYTEMHSTKSEIRIQLTDLHQGLYIIKIETGEKQYFLKAVCHTIR
jgi:hypothetical protein